MMAVLEKARWQRLVLDEGRCIGPLRYVRRLRGHEQLLPRTVHVEQVPLPSSPRGVGRRRRRGGEG